MSDYRLMIISRREPLRDSLPPPFKNCMYIPIWLDSTVFAAFEQEKQLRLTKWFQAVRPISGAGKAGLPLLSGGSSADSPESPKRLKFQQVEQGLSL